MPEKIEIDLAKVEALASQGLKRAAMAEGLGLRLGTYDMRRAKDRDFRAALERGLAKARNGNGRAEQPKLSEFEQEVLETLEANDGMRVDELVDATQQTRIEVSNAIRALGRHELIRADGDKYFANGPADPLPQPALARRSANKPPRKYKARQQKAGGRRARTDAHDPQAGMPALPATNGGHSPADSARLLEQARVELLYQRAHGEASPKFDEVVEGIEQQLVKAVAAGV